MPFHWRDGGVLEVAWAVFSPVFCTGCGEGMGQRAAAPFPKAVPHLLPLNRVLCSLCFAEASQLFTGLSMVTIYRMVTLNSQHRCWPPVPTVHHWPLS